MIVPQVIRGFLSCWEPQGPATPVAVMSSVRIVVWVAMSPFRQKCGSPSGLMHLNSSLDHSVRELGGKGCGLVKKGGASHL